PVDDLLQVTAGAERLVPRAGDDRNPQGGIVAKIQPGLRQQPERLEVQRVTALGPVDRDERDTALLLVDDRRHVTPWERPAGTGRPCQSIGLISCPRVPRKV